MKKLLLSALLSPLFMVANAYAHQVWIEQEGKSATLYFGEFADNLRETSPGLLDKLAPTATLVGKNSDKPLTLNKTPKGFVLSGAAAKGESIVAEEASYPIYESKKDGNVIRSVWTPAARYVSDFSEQKPKLNFDIVPAGKPGEFKVFYKGQPVPKVKVSAVIPSGWSKEETSDEQGLVRFDLPWRGTYVLEGHHTDNSAGERNGQPYDTASFVTSLTFVQPKGVAALPAGPAAAPSK